MLKRILIPWLLLVLLFPTWALAVTTDDNTTHTIGVRTYDGINDTFENIGPSTSGETLEEFLDKAYWEWDTIGEITTIDGVPTKNTKYKVYAGYIDPNKKREKPYREAIIPKEPEIRVNINGVRYVSFPDQKPVMRNQRVLVPIRPLLEDLQAKVTWDGQNNKITITRNNTTIELTIGSPIVKKDGQQFTLDVAPQLINDRTMVPVRFIAESFGARVEFQSDNCVVIDIEE